jgi:integrase
MSRPRGTGSVFRFKGTGNWWIKYHRNGKPVRENSHSPKVKDAERLLKRRMGEIAAGMWTGPKIDRTMMAELYQDLEREYRINGRKSIGHLKARWKLHLEPLFGALKASQVTSETVGRYIDLRQQAGAENATCNRELPILKRMFSLARRATPAKVAAMPYIPMLKESNTRTGFLESQQHDQLAAECGKVGLWLRALFEVGVTYGWRHEELLGLRVRQVNITEGVIRLEPNTTKNDEGREVTLTLPVRELLRECVRGKDADDYTFTRQDGKPVLNFRKTWTNVCEAAGCTGLLFHDLRRTAARNLRRAGVAEGVIMKIGGWKTRSVFERYAIVDQSDISAGISKLEIQQQRDHEQFGQSLGRNQAETSASRIALPLPAPLPN